jgi:hypothetical protein
MLLRFRLWTRFKLALRKRPVPSPGLPYGLDEFARLISCRVPFLATPHFRLRGR